MSTLCTTMREALLERRGNPRADDLELSAHLDGCPECSAFERRASTIFALVSTLPRRPVPAELAGLVVASTQAGHRQERTIRALSALSRLPAPSELDAAALQGGSVGREGIDRTEPSRTKAPRVLDRLVDEELRDQAGAISRRFAGRLGRRKAPRALRESLAGSDWTASRPRVLRRLVPIAAGVAFLVLAGVLYFQRPPEQDDGFQVVYETSLDSMDPMARGLLSGLSGGVVDPHVVPDPRTDGGGR